MYIPVFGIQRKRDSYDHSSVQIINLLMGFVDECDTNTGKDLFCGRTAKLDFM